MSGNNGNGGQRLSGGVFAGAGVGVLVWLLISLKSGAEVNAALFAAGSVIMFAGLAAGVLITRWANRFAGREEQPQPVKVKPERPEVVILKKYDDE